MSTVNVTLGQGQGQTAQEVLEVAVEADQLGYQQLWIGEMATFDAFSLATAVGLRTQQITPVVGPVAVSVRTPVGIAMATATVSDAIGRPAHLALGTSSNVVVSEWHGVPRERPVTRLAETTQVVRRLLNGEKVSFEGRTLSTHGYHLRLPAPEVTLSVAAFGPRAIETGARYADRVVLNMVTVESARQLCTQLTEAATAAGRTRPRVAVWLAASVDPTPADVQQMVGSKTGYLAAPGYSEMFEAAGFGDLVAFAKTRPHPKELRQAIPDEQMVGSVCLGGDVEEVRSRIDSYRSAGVDEVCVIPATASDPGGKRTLTALAPLT